MSSPEDDTLVADEETDEDNAVENETKSVNDGPQQEVVVGGSA